MVSRSPRTCPRPPGPPIRRACLARNSSSCSCGASSPPSSSRPPATRRNNRPQECGLAAAEKSPQPGINMNVKFNKDALLKHRFWILASVTAILTLTGIFYLVVYGSEAAIKARVELKNLRANAQKSTPASNQEGID